MSSKKNNDSVEKVPAVLAELWKAGFFVDEQSSKQIQSKFRALGSNPSPDALRVALARVSFLRRQGPKGNYRYIQKHPASKTVFLSSEVFPDQLARALAKDFANELEDLKWNYGKSGTCSAFLLRKILEKLIFVTFAKHGIEDKLKDATGGLVGLKAMLKLAVACKVHGTPFLLSKTATEIDGIKFLGDTSAHNPLVNVDMKIIVPVMPFIVIAFYELAKKL